MTKGRNSLFCFFICLLALMAGSGCSQTRLAIRFADTFISSEIKDQFDLTGLQKQISDQLSEKFVADFKEQVLKPVSGRLKSLAGQIDSLTGDNVESIVRAEKSELDRFILVSSGLAAKHIPELSSKLTAKNWDAYKENFAEENQKILAQTDSKSRFKDQFENFLGSLTPIQESLIDQWTKENPRNPVLRVKNRTHVLNEFERKMGPFTVASFQTTATQFLENPLTWQMSEHQENQKKRTEAAIKVIIEVGKTLNEKQKSHLKNYLLQLADDFTKN